MLYNTIRLTAAAALFGFAAADCMFANTYDQPGSADPPSGSQLCMGQGEGAWTFAMYNSAVEVPTIDGGGDAGYSGNTAFIIYDNTCAIQAVYGMPSCGTPYYAEENFLSDELILSSIDTTLGSEYFSFYYGNGKYSINNNGCVCNDMSSGLEGATGCRCAFPVDGIYTS